MMRCQLSYGKHPRGAWRLLAKCPKCKSINAGEYSIGVHQLKRSWIYTYWCACRDCRHKWLVSKEVPA